MTRFEQEITGLLGEYWKKQAEQDLLRSVDRADKDAVVDEDGAIRWKSNGQYLMDDFCEKLEYAGYLFSREETSKKRERQVEESLAQYRKNYRGLSSEFLAEARAVFGKGCTIVDVLSNMEVKL